MIPYKLRLENFLSYKDGLEPLEFAGMHLVCLIGENGHGKSALLDAITWVLWGKARASSDDDLMHTGSSEMQVEYEFGLTNNRYNIIRKRYLSGQSAKSDLEFAVWDESAGAWQALTEPTLRKTQQQINEVLRMDYDTFINSAFLKQGEADAFTSKSPGQRKDILATILNLSQYDAYAERAKEYAKQAEAEAVSVGLRLKEIEEELAQRPNYEDALRKASLAESQSKISMKEADLELSDMRLQVQALTNKQSNLQDLKTRVQTDLHHHEQTAQAMQTMQASLQEIEILLSERQAIQDAYARLEQAKEEDRNWTECLQKRRPLEREQQQLERQLLQAKADLEQELALILKSLSDAQARVEALPSLRSKTEEVREQIIQLEAHQVSNLARRERLASLKVELQQVGMERDQVKVEGDKLRERLDVLKTGETSDCPVCKQPLGEEGRVHLEHDYVEQLETLREQFRTLQSQAKAYEEEESILLKALKADEQELRVLESKRRQLAEVESALSQGEEAERAVADLQTSVESLQNQLAGEYAAELRNQLASVLAGMEALAYDETAHLQARATVSDLSGIERKYHSLEQAINQEESLREQVERLQTRWTSEEERLHDDRIQLEKLTQEVQTLPSTVEKLNQLTRTATELRSDWEAARDRVVRAQQQLLACDSLEETRRLETSKQTEVQEKAARYRHLQQAFGPRGVQAMIIEAALPELETEANRLLSRLSDGRMNIRLETQRELRSGGKRETLDIIVSDELGSRPYELYSGGEAFRADLSLRIALSRLLARRAGAALQTLFIDEGFGTQDTHGRENLVEAIHMIKDEFSLVLVITHIEELKEQFPVRIQVIKEEGQGSRYIVS